MEVNVFTLSQVSNLITRELHGCRNGHGPESIAYRDDETFVCTKCRDMYSARSRIHNPTQETNKNDRTR